jgi:hypothetical protein
MSILLSYLAPKFPTVELLDSAIYGGDMMLSKWRTHMPDDVRLAWRDHLRPALERWKTQLKENQRP